MDACPTLNMLKVADHTLRCKICNQVTTLVGEKRGRLLERAFEIVRCPACGFAFVANPWTEFDKVYSQAYYEGRGADPLVDYVFELEHPDESIRDYEWAGLVQVVSTLLKEKETFRWLDYGCAHGGLVRFVRQTSGIEMYGFEEGWIAEKARQSGIPLLDRAALVNQGGSFDVVTAIEVLEHVLDPLETLRHVRSLLKPGGLFYFSTGNARKQREQLLAWPYLIPEIHISLYEPGTLALALEKTGFRAEYSGYLAGHSKMIQARVLKKLRVKKKSWWQSCVPCRLLAPVIDKKVGFTEQPIGWAV